MHLFLLLLILSLGAAQAGISWEHFREMNRSLRHEGNRSEDVRSAMARVRTLEVDPLQAGYFLRVQTARAMIHSVSRPHNLIQAERWLMDMEPRLTRADHMMLVRLSRSKRLALDLLYPLFFEKALPGVISQLLPLPIAEEVNPQMPVAINLEDPYFTPLLETYGRLLDHNGEGEDKRTVFHWMRELEPRWDRFVTERWPILSQGNPNLHTAYSLAGVSALLQDWTHKNAQK